MTTFPELAQDVARQTWGFVPDRAVKPVHFANGFVRALFGGQAAAPRLLQIAGAGVRKGAPAVTTEQLLSDLRGRYESADRNQDLAAVSDLRSALDLVLNQDRGYYPRGPFSATLTHYLQCTADGSDRGSGQFVAELLSAGDGEDLIATFRGALTRPDDNVYLLTAPLLQDREPGPPPVARENVAALAQRTPVLQAVQRAFGTLARHEGRLEKTVFLQRMVTLGSFSLLLALFDQPDETVPTPLVPLLLCAPRPREDAREASRATFARARQRIERVFERGLTEELQARGLDGMAHGEYRDLADSWTLSRGERSPLGELTRSGRQEAKIWQQFSQDYEGFLLGTENPFDAFRYSVVRACFVAMDATGGEDPEGFAASLGRMLGLAYPRSAGRGGKYFRPGPQFLDALVVALLEPGEEIPEAAFWERAWQSFGLMSGALGTTDAQRLSRWGIRQTTPTALRENGRALLSELVRMGHAREYADDIAMIGIPGSVT